jgi:hypothetical protein
MTRLAAINNFVETVFPDIRKKESLMEKVDMPLRREVWNVYVDSLHRDGQITDWQASNWNFPEILEA